MTLLTDLRFALRSFARARGLAFTVIVTLALGIGANAAIFSVVRGVLLKPLANRDEDRLLLALVAQNLLRGGFARSGEIQELGAWLLAEEANFQPKCVSAIDVSISESQSVDSKR